MVDGKIRVVVATPLSDELCQLIVEREPRVEIICEQQLLPPMRWPGDHEGDPAFTRSPEQQSRFEALLETGDAYYGIPDTNPSLLSKMVTRNPQLRWIHTMAAGGGHQIQAANLDPADLERVLVTTSAGPHSETLAEFALFGVLAGAKGLPRLQADQTAKLWPDRWLMRHLSQMTICVVALGSIGRSVAQKLSMLGATVIGVNRSMVQADGVSDVYQSKDLVTAVARADAVINTAPGTDATFQLIGQDAFAAMKPNTIVVNVGRGSVIDEKALIDAIQDGTVGFAALDVFAREPLSPESPLWAMDNVIISPHTAALSVDEDHLIAELFADNATAILDGRQPKNIMDTTEFY